MTEAVFEESSLLPRLPFTKKLRTVLEGLSADHPVGFGAVPRVKVGTTWQPVSEPYFILYPSWSRPAGGGWNTPDADVEWFYQVACVSDAGDQNEWMRDRLLRLLLGRRKGGQFLTPLPVAGMSVMDRWLEDDTGVPGDSPNGVFRSDLRFGFKVTPTR